MSIVRGLKVEESQGNHGPARGVKWGELKSRDGAILRDLRSVAPDGRGPYMLTCSNIMLGEMGTHEYVCSITCVF